MRYNLSSESGHQLHEDDALHPFVKWLGVGCEQECERWKQGVQGGACLVFGERPPGLLLVHEDDAFQHCLRDPHHLGHQLVEVSALVG